MTEKQLIEECWQYQRDLELLVKTKELTRVHESYLRHDALATQGAAIAQIRRAAHFTSQADEIVWERGADV